MPDSQQNKLKLGQIKVLPSLTNCIFSGLVFLNIIALNLIFGPPKQFISTLFVSRNTDH